jgi:hypothetical protein
MRIGFDLDGVLADLHRAFAATATELFPEIDRAALGSADVGASPPSSDDVDGSTRPPPSSPRSRSATLTRQQSDAVWAKLADTEDFWESLQEIEPGIVAEIARVGDERRWEVIFITSRPRSAGRTIQRQTQRWLERHGFPLPSAFVVHGSRGLVAKALRLDVIVDDRSDNCLDVVHESEAAAILVWRGGKRSTPDAARDQGIAVVATVREALDSLTKLDRGKGPGLFDRIQAMFGLRRSRGR